VPLLRLDLDSTLADRKAPDPRRYARNVAAGELYDRIGRGYAVGRRTDPRIAARIWEALGDARTVLNVGAGSGSYEPADREVLAVEPSRVMRAQRPAGAAPCIDAAAESLPFADGAFDAAMAILSDHHWSDPLAGLREMARVARRVVVFQCDERWFERFWLVRDYMPEFARLGRRGPSLASRAAALEASTQLVPIPWDCVDGFFGAFWRRPDAYLDPAIRRNASVWSQVGEAVELRVVDALAGDLESGAWHQRNHELLALQQLDLGYRLLVKDFMRRAQM
jgi:SAM-dependent methyltransferase